MRTLEEILELNFGSEDEDICNLSWADLKKKAKSEILELQKQELALKCAGIEELILREVGLDINVRHNLATKLTEWMTKEA